MRKIVIYLLLTPMICLSSCGNKERIRIDGNIDTFLLEKDNYYIKGDVDEIASKIEYSSSFLVYFTNSGCSACERFSPIMDSYLKSVDYSVYRFELGSQRDEIKRFNELWGDKFFSKEDGVHQIVTPSLYVVDHNFNVQMINYDSYMQTENAFKNHMKSRYESSNIYFTSGDVLKDNLNKSFVYIHFDFSNDELKNIYNSKLKDVLENTDKKVVVSNYIDDGKLHLSSNYDGQMKDMVILNETTNEQILEFF